MSKIEWCDETWNPTRGCSRVSPGCENCYAERQAHRMNYDGTGRRGAYLGLTELSVSGEPRWNGKIRLVPELLDQPLRWRKPRRVFVDSMSDLFHESIPPLFIAKVFATMAHARRHTFQILTKRPERMKVLLDESTFEGGNFFCFLADELEYPGFDGAWPLPNVWLGVSVEDQKRADERIPLLLQTPAAVRFLSVEPLLGPVYLSACWPQIASCTRSMSEKTREALADIARAAWRSQGYGGIDWVIVGGESGPGSRPCRIEWVRSIVSQCRVAEVPCFVKQLGSNPSWAGTSWNDTASLDHEGRLRSRKGGEPAEWPEDLRVREFPDV